MFKKNKLISAMIFISLLLSISAEASSTCGRFKIRWIENRKFITRSEDICVDGDRAFSKDCVPLIQKSCPFSSLKKNKSVEKMIRQIGSPSFNLCHSIEGSPQAYEIKIGNEWKNFERCFWKKLNSFVELSELSEFYYEVL